ncbi:MAG: hypothetical protein ACI9HK_005028 [Pirellulaceae bacterium]|jgi:hypothetical protein
MRGMGTPLFTAGFHKTRRHGIVAEESLFLPNFSLDFSAEQNLVTQCHPRS